MERAKVSHGDAEVVNPICLIAFQGLLLHIVLAAETVVVPSLSSR